MAPMHAAFAWAAGLSFVLWPLAARAAEDLKLIPQQGWSCVLADRDAALSFKLDSGIPFEGAAAWSLHVEGRVLARGEAAIRASAASPGQLTIPFKAPQLRDGVVLPIELAIGVSPRPSEPAVASHKQRMWVFADNPFSGRSRWLEKLNITLFDPLGETAERFEKMEIPLRRVRTTAALRESGEGVIVIGEGTSPAAHRDLAQSLFDLCADGRRIVCLAPAAGMLAVPERDALPQRLPGLHLQGRQSIARLDKRLDTRAWLGVEENVASSLIWGSQRGRPVMEIVEDGRGWPWLEVEYPERQGLLVVCGFGVIRHWTTGPVPRYLFASLLEHIHPTGTHSNGN